MLVRDICLRLLHKLLNQVPGMGLNSLCFNRSSRGLRCMFKVKKPGPRTQHQRERLRVPKEAESPPADSTKLLHCL